MVRARLSRSAVLAALLLGAALVLAGCHTPPRDYTPTAARFYLEASSGEGAVMTLPQSGVQVPISAKPVLSEFDIVDAELVQVELGRCLMFRLTPSAARDLYRLTASHQGSRLVLTLNGVALGARRIDGPMGEGTVLIFVEMPDEQLPALVRNLKLTAGEIQRAAARAS
jgi:hypothetical protein